MLELALALGLLGAVCAAVIVLFWLPWLWLVVAGLALSSLGLLCGLPAALRYHLLLYRFVSEDGSPSRGWWVAPHKLHGALTPLQRARLLPWWRIGGGGFLLVMTGALMLGLALWSGPGAPAQGLLP